MPMVTSDVSVDSLLASFVRARMSEPLRICRHAGSGSISQDKPDWFSIEIELCLGAASQRINLGDYLPCRIIDGLHNSSIRQSRRNQPPSQIIGVLGASSSGSIVAVT